MRKLRKSEAPASLTRLLPRLKGKNWEYFHDHHFDVYIECIEQALSDQDHECAYTGVLLSGKSRAKAHIDHYHKKGMFTKLTFEWTNMLAAVKDEKYGVAAKDSRIRLNEEYDNLLNPLTDDVDHYFYFSTDGGIEPAAGLSKKDREKAQYTIDIFNLDKDPKLRHLRRQAMSDYRNLIENMGAESIQYRGCMGFTFLFDFEKGLATEHATQSTENEE